MLEEKTSTDELFEHIVAVAEEHGLVQAGDIAVITAGIPLGISGTTNMLKVHLVGDVLVSGTVVNELSTCGPLCVCKTEEEALQKFRRGDILVLPKTTNATMPLIRQASGIVTEMDGCELLTRPSPPWRWINRPSSARRTRPTCCAPAQP